MTTSTEHARRLDDLLEQAWDSGWQPGDLHAYVSRHWDALTVKVLGDAMAANLARYAPATVDDRWRDQLVEAAASTWWPPESDHLAARAVRTVGGWHAVAGSCDILGLALARLPSLERLGPRPGFASSRVAADVDERLLTKVRMMLAKAESTPYEAEAEAFTAAAHSLMTRHSIDRAVLDAGAGAGVTADGPGAVRIPIPAPYARDKFSLLSAVARANRSKAVWHDDLGLATVVGFPVDRRAVELLFASLLVQVMVAIQGHRASRPDVSARTFRRSFLTGFTHRVAERLVQVAQSEAEAAREQRQTAHLEGGNGVPGVSPPSSGTDIVRILADRERAVATSVKELFPSMSTMRSRARLEAEGWFSGRAAGDRASLGGAAQLRGAS